MTPIGLHPLFETPIPRGWELLCVDDIKAAEKSACVAGPFGSNISSKYFVESGVPVIRGGNLRDDLTQFVPQGFAFVSGEQATKYKAQHVRAGDLVFTCWGTVGQVGLIPKDGPFPEYIISNKQLKLRPNLDITDPLYLFYYFAGPKMVQHVLGKAIGAAVPGINLGILKQLPVVLPPLREQRRIAAILSAYDALIDNSQRRIQILETMARTLYREWFVHFRFPGYENVPRVASALGEIPQGWEAKRLDQVCRSIQDGDWVETKDQGGHAYRLLQISNIGVGEFIETGNFRFISQSAFERLRCTEIMPGDLLVARMPTPIGRAWLASAAPWKMVTAVDVAIVRTRLELLDPRFLFLAWNETANLKRIAAQASGTTRLRITRRELAALEFVIPPPSIQSHFTRLIEPMMALVQSLRLQAGHLRQTRDLLLPRLMSGQLAKEAVNASN